MAQKLKDTKKIVNCYQKTRVNLKARIRLSLRTKQIRRVNLWSDLPVK